MSYYALFIALGLLLWCASNLVERPQARTVVVVLACVLFLLAAVFAVTGPAVSVEALL